jgi:phosphoglycerol transferase
MFLPVDGHRIAAFARLKAAYHAGLQQISPTMDNEANTAALGILMALGFLVSLLAFAFWPGRGSPPGEGEHVDLLRTAGFLNLCALLLATVGGFGAMIAVVLPQIRSYNRISVFIGFIAVVALAALAERGLGRWANGPRRVVLVAALVALTVLAVLDQTPPSLASAPAQVAQYRSDVAFGATLSKALPAGSVVFQIPYMPFPEPGGAVFGMQDYDPLRGYLHVDGLRWSYGAMKGRADDAWQKATAALPPAEMIAAAKARGFTALWVQLNGYGDGGAAVRAALTGLLGEPVAVSEDGVFALWKL